MDPRLNRWLDLISARICTVLADPDVGRADVAEWHAALTKRRIRAVRVQRRRVSGRSLRRGL